MQRAEQEGLTYLFKLRITAGVKRSVERLMREAPWTDAGLGWEGTETPLRLTGWSRTRRTIVLRRRVTGDLVVVDCPGRPDISHPHARAAWGEQVCRDLAAFFKTLPPTAEPLTPQPY